MGDKRRAREAAQAQAAEAQAQVDAEKAQADALAKSERQGRAAEVELMSGRLRALYRQGTLTTDQAIGAALALKVLEERGREIRAMRDRFDRG
jgi:hypothetical protein